MKSVFTPIGLFLIYSLSAQSFDPAFAAKLQIKLDSLQNDLDIKGISVSIIIPDIGQWNGVSGESYLGVPIDSSMLFHVASNTKTFTATTFLKFVENGQADLDDSLHQWIPNYNINIDSNITIRQLLNHTSGIANTFDVPGFSDSLSADWGRIFSPQEILSWLPSPNFAPGTAQSYSNPNYNLTGLIIESIIGQPLEKVIRDSIFTLMNLTDTYFPIFDTIIGTVAHPWQNGIDLINQPRTSLLTANWASGAIYSTSSDMAQWYDQLMNYGFLENAAFMEMTTFVGPQDRGIGIQNVSIAGITAYGHGGGTIGYGSIMIFDPNSKIVLCVLVNDGNANQFIVAEELLKISLNCTLTKLKVVNTNESFTLFPNPANDEVILNTNQDYHDLSIEVFDLTGRILLSQTNDPIINTAHLKSGNYFFLIKIDGIPAIRKMVVKN